MIPLRYLFIEIKKTRSRYYVHSRLLSMLKWTVVAFFVTSVVPFEYYNFCDRYLFIQVHVEFCLKVHLQFLASQGDDIKGASLIHSIFSTS